MHCEFCKKEFKLESKLFSHQCEKKRRYMQKDTKSAIIGLYAWNRFKQLNKIKNKKGESDLDNFINSRYYSEFVKFGEKLITNQCINPNAYIDFCIKNSFSLKLWYEDKTYNLFVSEYIKIEDPYSAIERSIKTIDKWAEENNLDTSEFYLKANTNKVTNWILSGKISPWLLLCSKKTNELLERFDEKQQELLANKLDPSLWRPKMMTKKKDVEHIQEILESGNL